MLHPRLCIFMGIHIVRGLWAQEQLKAFQDLLKEGLTVIDAPVIIDAPVMDHLLHWHYNTKLEANAKEVEVEGIEVEV